ncbi:hypothetical protein [Acetobacter syzygii]|nr:hypothetical protein [Acetobacter syzygii]
MTSDVLGLRLTAANPKHFQVPAIASQADCRLTKTSEVQVILLNFIYI